MRHIALTLALLFLTTPSAAQCDRETDKFTGESSLTCDGRTADVRKQPIHRLYRARVIAYKTGGEFGFVLSAGADSWNWLRVEEAHALVDSSRHTYPVVADNQEVTSTVVVEQLIFTVSEEQARDVASASSVRIKVGNAVLDITPITDDFETILQMQ
jgi:hypothetical protein